VPWLLPALLFALSDGALQAAGLVAVAVVTGGVSYVVSRRGTSGTITTSDAATLWEAAETIRSELRAEVVARRETEAQLRERIAVLEAEQQKYQGCRERVAALEAEVARLTGTPGD